MSTRHRARQSGPSSALQEEREQRKAEHRRVRRTVNQSLHVAVLEEDLDGLVLQDLCHLAKLGQRRHEA